MSEKVAEFFNVRAVNVTKLESLADCDIIIAECEFAVQRIDKDIAARAHDSAWRDAALDAREALLHKKHLSELKRTSIQERLDLHKIRAAVPNENSFKNRFVKAAKDLLPPETYNEISVLAGETGLSGGQ